MKAKTTKKCRSRGCRGIITGKNCHSPYCSRCRSRRWAKKYPLHYSYNNLKKRAIQRGKDFQLTREEYVGFAIKTDYARMKGRTSLSLSIDRKDNSGPYAAWNIQAITLRANSRKQLVPFFAAQMENLNFEPTSEDLAAIQQQLNNP